MTKCTREFTCRGVTTRSCRRCTCIASHQAGHEGITRRAVCHSIPHSPREDGVVTAVQEGELRILAGQNDEQGVNCGQDALISENLAYDDKAPSAPIS
jgi:hypothetical protein